MNKEFEKGDYVLGKECVGIDTIREMKGWVISSILSHGGKILGYNIQCDDEWNGCRSNGIYYKYDDIVKLECDRKPNNDVNSY